MFGPSLYSTRIATVDQGIYERALSEVKSIDLESWENLYLFINEFASYGNAENYKNCPEATTIVDKCIDQHEELTRTKERFVNEPFIPLKRRLFQPVKTLNFLNVERDLKNHLKACGLDSDDIHSTMAIGRFARQDRHPN
jgi:hypothetical protein